MQHPMHPPLVRSLTTASASVAVRAVVTITAGTLTLGLGTSASAANRYVATCGNDTWAGVNPGCAAPIGPKRTLQAAINSASSGDTIYVLPGVYNGAIDLDGKAVTIVSTDGAGVTFLERSTFGSIVTCNSGEGPDTVLEGFTLRNSFTLGRGGGLFCGFSSPTIVACVFDSNESQDEGGAVAAVAAAPTFIDCVFIDNSSWGSGGAISVEDGALTAITCTFDGNESELDHGGAISARYSDLSILGCGFTANRSENYGAAMTAIFCDVSIGLSGFHHNGDVNGTGTRRGGAIWSSYTDLSVAACTFTNNASTEDGGAITIAGWTTYDDVVISGSVFSQNTAGEEGGAISVANGFATITNSTFSGNEAHFGGAVRVRAWVGQPTPDEAIAVVTNCTFEANHAFSGAGVYSTWTTHATDCVFTENVAESVGGGASLYLPGHHQVENCLFEANEAASGAGASVGAHETVVRNSTFRNNTAETGAGLIATVTTTTPRVVSCLFRNNTTTEGSAAIGVGSGAGLVVVNSVIAWNSTTADGGAVRVFSGSLQMKNSTVANNVGGGIFGGEFASHVGVDNSIVWGNTSGPETWGLGLAVRYSNVQGGMPGIGNMNANPMFIGAFGVNYRLQPGSPCIDAGSNWLIGTDVDDLDGDGSTAELVPFDFDGNPRLADAPAPDTGCGADAVIDLGPFESAGTPASDVLFADLDGNGTIDGSDLGLLLAAFGAFGCNLADLNGDGQVDGGDLGLMLGAWGG